MGKYNYDWRIDYYANWNLLKTAYITAKSREEALRKLRDSGVSVLEVVSCRRIDRW